MRSVQKHVGQPGKEITTAKYAFGLPKLSSCESQKFSCLDFLGKVGVSIEWVGGMGWGWERKRDFCLQFLFNSKPEPTSKRLKSQMLLKIAFNTIPSSLAPAGKVKQMALID